MLVYRVEDSDGRGPHDGGGGERMYERAARRVGRARFENDPWDHPPPQDDHLLSDVWVGMGFERRRAHYFGFQSVDHLLGWFSAPWRRALRRCGGLAAVYECPEESVCFGARQLIFVRESASLVTRRRLPADARDVQRLIRATESAT